MHRTHPLVQHAPRGYAPTDVLQHTQYDDVRGKATSHGLGAEWTDRQMDGIGDRSMNGGEGGKKKKK